MSIFSKRKNGLANIGESIGAGRAPAAAATPAPSAPAEWADVTRIGSVYSIPTAKVMLDPGQPRKVDPADPAMAAKIEALAGAIGREGQLVPVSVRWSPEHGLYLMREGECRYHACARLGRNLDCTIEAGEAPAESDLRYRQYVANEARNPLNPVEKAQFFEERMAAGDTGAEVARRCGVTESLVSRMRKLLALPEGARRLVASGELAWTKAEALVPLGAREASDLARRAVAGGWSRARIEAEVDAALGVVPPAETPPVAQGGPVAGAVPLTGESARPAPREDLPAAGTPPETPAAPVAGAVPLTGETPTSPEADAWAPPPDPPTPAQELRREIRKAAASIATADAPHPADAHIERVKRKAEEGALDLPDDHEGLPVADWLGPAKWGGSTHFDYGEPGPGGPDDLENGSGLTVRLAGVAAWPDAVAILKRAWDRAKWRAQLAAVAPSGARPGDRVELVEPEERLRGKSGVIRDRVDDLLWVEFDGLPGDVGTELRCHRGEALRRAGP